MTSDVMLLLLLERSAGRTIVALRQDQRQHCRHLWLCIMFRFILHCTRHCTAHPLTPSIVISGQSQRCLLSVDSPWRTGQLSECFLRLAAYTSHYSAWSQLTSPCDRRAPACRS